MAKSRLTNKRPKCSLRKRRGQLLPFADLFGISSEATADFQRQERMNDDQALSKSSNLHFECCVCHFACLHLHELVFTDGVDGLCTRGSPGFGREPVLLVSSEPRAARTSPSSHERRRTTLPNPRWY